MKRTVLVICLIAGWCGNAVSDLGDTYDDSKHRYGSPNGTKDDITWWTPKGTNATRIGETFYHNQCVAIYYVPAQGQSISESEIWRLLTMNSKPGATWNVYQRNSSGAQYANQDNTLYARFDLPSGILRICYTSHLKRQGLLQPPFAANNNKNKKDKGSPINLDGLDTFTGELGGGLHSEN